MPIKLDVGWDGRRERGEPVEARERRNSWSKNIIKINGRKVLFC
jgi:hypothetical protein